MDKNIDPVRITQGHLYKSLSKSELTDAGLRVLGKDRSKAFVRAFLQQAVPGLGSEESVQGRLKWQALKLKFRPSGTQGNSKKGHRSGLRGEHQSRGKALSSRQRRKLGAFKLKPERQRYSIFLPLHHLWLEYIEGLVGGFKSSSCLQTLQNKLLKADLHGAIVKVYKSRCPSYIGTCGIVIQELKNVLKIITAEDKVKVLPKNGSVFEIKFGPFSTLIYGSKFCVRAAERAAKKFKTKGSIDL
uniref:ribonuclease P protein subunit p29-like n=1 Tax=Myxine glutinosa TaxID=7769 RepID=UPI00358E8166